ncbi:MAG: hypothetical protein R3F37_21340 [Candidatus Competibacteraceae bacterium]
MAKPLIYTALRLAKGLAHLAGFGELQQFIEAGFNAFRHVGKANTFWKQSSGVRCKYSIASTTNTLILWT